MLDFLFKKEVSASETLNNFYSSLRELYSFDSISDERKDYLKTTMAKYFKEKFQKIQEKDSLLDINQGNGVLPTPKTPNFHCFSLQEANYKNCKTLAQILSV